jgi:hypothetical protein
VPLDVRKQEAACRQSGNDVAARTRLVGVRRDGLVGFEVPIPLHRKAELAAGGGELGERHIAKFRAAKIQVAEPEGETAVGIEFRQEPGALRIGREEFDDGLEVECFLALVDRGALCPTIGEEFFGE